MQNANVLKVILFVAGLIGILVGAAILIAPVAFHATTGIDLGHNVSLLNEVRASGGALLAGGLLVVGGAFIADLRFTATIVAAALYLSYGLSRLLSMVVDGLPDRGLMAVAALEITIGSVCAMALVKYRRMRPI